MAKKWEVTILKLEKGEKVLYKVTKRVFTLNTAETRIFSSKEEAYKQFHDWLQ